MIPCLTFLWPWSVAVAGAAVLALHRSGRSLAEAGAFGLTGTIVVFAAGAQINRATGQSWPGTLALAAVALAGLAVIWRQRSGFSPLWAGLLAFARAHPLALATMAAAWGYRGLIAATGSRFLENPLSVKAVAVQKSATLAMAGPLVAMGWTQGCQDHFAFMAYGAIGLATYALSRRHAWPSTAATAAMVVLSMPRVVHPHPDSAGEIILAAMAAVVLLAVYRGLEQSRIDDLMAVPVGIGFLWSATPLGWVLPGILTVLAAMMLYRRHGLPHLAHMARSHRWWVIGALAMALLVSPAWKNVGAPPIRDEPAQLENNPRGLAGAADNLARALVATANLGLPQHRVAQAIGLWWQTRVESVYANTIEPLTHGPGGGTGFALAGRHGFGPLALLAAVPAIGYCLVVGPRRLRALAMALTGYFYLIVLIPAWSPAAIFLLTPLMVLCGAPVAFFLPPWRLTLLGRRSLQIICLLLLVYGSMP